MMRLKQETPPWQHFFMVLNEEGNVIGQAHDLIYHGAGYAVQTREFCGFVSNESVIVEKNEQLYAS